MREILENGISKLSTAIDFSGFYLSQFMNSNQNAMILMDCEGYILIANKAFEDQFGYSQDDLAGKHTRMFFTLEDQHSKKPEIEIATVKEHGACEDNNYLVQKDGSRVWVMGESVLVNSGKEVFISKIIHNIHTQKVMERFLVESNELVESILKTIKDGLVVIDADLRILKTNQAFYKIFEIPEETIEGIMLYDLNYAFWNEAEMKVKLETMIDGNNYFKARQFIWQKRDGSVRILNVTAQTMDYAAHTNHRILMVISDVTVEKELEQQKEDLIGFVTHELRNPLANMALCAELMEDSIKENRVEETEEYLTKTRINLRRLTNVVSELHDATVAGSGQLKIQKQLINYKDVLNDAIETVSLLYPSHKIILTGNANLEFPGDRHRLSQVINNYLTNAIKYSPGSGKVLIDVSSDGATVTTAVTDFGEGIPENQLPNVFRRYYRIENSTGADGLGLGLYLSREIILGHEGQVWVESKEHTGSTFYFSLPLAR